jgi:hypothetical protein
MGNRIRSEVQWITSAGLPLVRIKHGMPEVAVVIAGPVIGYYVHWLEELKRTQPCFVFRCQACDDQVPRRAMSYVGCMHFRLVGDEYLWRPAVLEVPHRTGDLLSGMVGKRVALKRDRRFGPVNVGTYLFDEELPKIKPVEFVQQLLAMWRVQPGQQVALVGNLGPAND